MSIADKNLDDSMPPTVARDARGADVDVTAEGESLVPDVPASPPETTQPAPVAPPSEQEKREIKIAQNRVVGRRRPARAKVQSKRYGSRSFSSPHTDIAGHSQPAEAAKSNLILHFNPAGSRNSGLGSWRRTPNVPLAASSTLSTITTVASYSPPIGSSGWTLALSPAAIRP